jgi:hypothetical protein
VLDAVEKVQARIEELRQAKVGLQQLQLKFGDPSSLRATDVAESPTAAVSRTFPPTAQQLVTTAFLVLW